jgi:shikimate dehydrogenase
VSPGPRTTRVGLIGYPLGHSISPAFQQAAFDALGLDTCYERWEVPPAELGAASGRLRDPATLGANVTIPHKQAICTFLDAVDPLARAIGAVNTIARDGGRLIGYNTDAAGFARSVQVDGRRELQGARLIVLGAGGAARAVAAAAIQAGAAEVVVRARRPERAVALVADLGHSLSPDGVTRLSAAGLPLRGEAPDRFDVLVNATPVGMHGNAAEADVPVPPEWLGPGTLVCDLVYNPPTTPLLVLAREQGADVLNGLPMLIYQGAAAFERWTGRAAPVDLMRRVAEEALRG